MARRRSRLTGAKRLKRLLRRLPDEITQDLKDVGRKSVEMVQKEAVALVPVDTGNLRQTLANPRAIGKKNKGLRWEFGLRGKKQQRVAFYAHYVEYGTKGYTVHGFPVSARPAQPFMRPALNKSRPKIRAMYKAAIGKTLKKVGLKGRRGG